MADRMWYLLLPPSWVSSRADAFEVEPDAGWWGLAYRNERVCNRARAARGREALETERAAQEAPYEQRAQAANRVRTLALSQCVASDDPRLARTPPAGKAAGLVDEALKEVTSGAKPSRGVNLSKLLPEDSGTAIIPFTAGRPIVDVRINGSTQARLLLDTGADRTTIAPRILRALGLAPRSSTTLRGVAGQAMVGVYEIASLEVGAVRVSRLTVLGHDTGEAAIDGLLGRDFLDHFKVTIDNAAGRVTLSPK